MPRITNPDSRMSVCLPHITTVNRRFSRVLIFLLSTLVWCVPSSSIANLDDDEREEAAEQLQHLKKRIQQIRGDLNKTRNKHDKERNRLRDIELKIGKHNKELTYIKYRLRKQDRRLEELYRDKRKYETDLKIQQQILSRQLRVSYMMGQQAYLKLLLSQENPAAAGRTMTYYDYFNRTRSDRINKARTVLASVNQVKADIEQEKKRLTRLQQENQLKKVELEDASQQRSVIVARLESSLKDKTGSLQQLLEDEQQLQKLLNPIREAIPEMKVSKANRKSFAKLRGQLQWPVQGKIKQLFGRKRGTSMVKWNGVIINSKPGRNIRAVSHGRIAYADWLRGYGLLVIIDHGQGYMSLYGHNQSLLKETGDWVDSDEVIATVGNSGGQKHSGVYFEIRHKGQPSNPNRWCRKRRS